MLSQKATKLTVALCEKIKDAAFVIYSWEDIFDLLGEDKPESLDDCKQLFEEVRLNACLTLKYKDSDQACFSMTDKARLITQDLEAMTVKTKIKEPMIKTDDSGRSVLVLPSTDNLLKGISGQTATSKVMSFIYGILGGLVGGVIGGLIAYLIISVIGG